MAGARLQGMMEGEKEVGFPRFSNSEKQQKESSRISGGTQDPVGFFILILDSALDRAIVSVPLTL